MWSLIRVWSPDGHWVKVSLEFIVCVFADRLLSSTVWSPGVRLMTVAVLCVCNVTRRGQGGSQWFSGLHWWPPAWPPCQRLSTPHCDAQGQYRFCGSAVTVLTAHIALIESSLWECLTKSASMSLCFMYNEKIASSEQIVGCCVLLRVTVPAKNQLRPLGVSSFALLSIVTERKKKPGREMTQIYMMQHWPHDTTDQSMFSMQSQYHAQGKSRHILSEHYS